MTKITFTLLVILFQCIFGISQTHPILSSAQKQQISNYLTQEADSLASEEFRVLLHLDYGESVIKNRYDIRKIFTGEIQAVRLYYSDFPKGKNFDALNSKRIENLLADIPRLADSTISWTLIKQTDCNNRLEAAQLFHGFEIILKYVGDLELADLRVDTTFKDFVVQKVLKRNDWKDMLIVTDMTGSMSPYISQLFLWLKLNTIDERIKQFIFFNDGDTQLDKNKKLGETGGIYQTKSKDYEEVELTAIQCIISGDGGDLPENDAEALLKGMKLCPDCVDHILIADNHSDIRDSVLIANIDKPIRVIVCGVEQNINPQYLNLARKTGGSVHLMERDLFDLIKMNEGETIEIGERIYVIRKDKFVELKKT